MNIEVRYYTKSGNSRKLAAAIADELQIEAKDVSVPLDKKADILFLCNSVYWAGADGRVKDFIRNNAGKIGTLVNVSTAAMLESTYGQIKKICEKTGVGISDKEFHCRGKFAALHQHHPDEADIRSARAFAKDLAGAEL